ncbi:MAG: tyrosine-type recombinase/integrase [Desulfovibrio sp.]|nr:tyrosine-type recombinase/integrase [Desulfovibrio sp.]
MKNNTLATFKEKRDGFKRFIRYLEQTTGLSPDDPVGSFDRKQSRRYLAWQHDQRGPNCSNKDRKVLTTAWKWGFSYMDNFPMDRPDPFLSCPRYAEKRCPRNIPPEEDFWKMYEAAYEREKALLTCFLNLAARKGELLKLTWEDVDFQRGTVVLTTRKTRTGTVKRDEMPMNEDVRQTMLWLSESGGHKQPCLYLRHRGFSREAVQVRGSCHGEALRKGGCESFGFHAIRHLAATILAQEGKSLFAIQHVLRHEK